MCRCSRPNDDRSKKSAALAACSGDTPVTSTCRSPTAGGSATWATSTTRHTTRIPCSNNARRLRLCPHGVALGLEAEAGRERVPERLRELTAANPGALEATLRWHVEHDIPGCRISSRATPFGSHRDTELDERAAVLLAGETWPTRQEVHFSTKDPGKQPGGLLADARPVGIPPGRRDRWRPAARLPARGERQGALGAA